MCKVPGSNSQKRRRHLDFVRLSAKSTTWHHNFLVSVSSILGVKLDLILVLRSQFFDFLRETLYKHALEHLAAVGPEKKGIFFLLPTLNVYLLLTSVMVFRRPIRLPASQR